MFWRLRSVAWPFWHALDSRRCGNDGLPNLSLRFTNASRGDAQTKAVRVAVVQHQRGKAVR
jgi:hypothetical protein